jgi:hypothetical protein
MMINEDWRYIPLTGMHSSLSNHRSPYHSELPLKSLNENTVGFY